MRSPPARGEDALWVGAAAVAAVIAVAALTVAEPLGSLLLRPAGFHFFPVWTQLVHPKPTQETRYLLAVALTIAAAVELGLAPAPRRVAAPGWALRLGPVAVKLGLAGLAVWCFRRYTVDRAHAGVGHFGFAALAAGVGEIVGALRRAGGTRFYPGKAGSDPAEGAELARDGLRVATADPASQLTEWRLP